MKCRKCDCLILETDKHCPMCGVKQRNSLDNRVIIILSALITVAVFGIGFVLFNMVDFNSNGRDLRSQGNNDYIFFLNQMNSTTTRGRIFLTEDSVYFTPLFTNGEIIVLDHDFNEESTIIVRDDWVHIEELYVTDDAIYYTAGFEGDLYRYDRETGENQHLANNIFRQTVVGDQIFHMSEPWGDSNLYVFDKVNGETSIVFEGDVRKFLINVTDDTIIFINDLSLYRIDFYGGNLEQLNNDAFWVTFDGETLVWSELRGGVYMMDFNTGIEIRVSHEVDPFNMLIAEDYIIITEWTDDFYMNLSSINRDSNHLQLLAEDVMSFAILGDEIVYELWDGPNLYAMDFEGNSRILIEGEFSQGFNFNNLDEN